MSEAFLLLAFVSRNPYVCLHGDVLPPFFPLHQGLDKDASYMVQLAKEARNSRGLAEMPYNILQGEEIVQPWLCSSRHLY